MPSLDPPLGPGDHTRGPADAPAVLVMYGDYECPFCQAAQSVLARVDKRMGDELRFGFRHFLIEDRHPRALPSAELVEAASARGLFWEAHEALFAKRGRLEDADLREVATELGLAWPEIEAELADRRHEAVVRAQHATGIASGVTGTPGFFVNGVLHEDSFDASSLIEALRGG